MRYISIASHYDKRRSPLWENAFTYNSLSNLLRLNLFDLFNRKQGSFGDILY